MDLSFALGPRDAARSSCSRTIRTPTGSRSPSLPASAPSGYVQLTGNEVGVLLGHYLLTEQKDRGAEPARPRVDRLVAAARRIAKALGVAYEETLTGFKWIANRAMDSRRPGKRFVFGYEEALGYTVGDAVRDKDGISAAVVMAEMVGVAAATRGGRCSTSSRRSTHVRPLRELAGERHAAGGERGRRRSARS